MYINEDILSQSSTKQKLEIGSQGKIERTQALGLGVCHLLITTLVK